MTDHYDVIVTGSRPHGGTLTYALAAAGQSAAAVSA